VSPSSGRLYSAFTNSRATDIGSVGAGTIRMSVRASVCQRIHLANVHVTVAAHAGPAVRRGVSRGVRGASRVGAVTRCKAWMATCNTVRCAATSASSPATRSRSAASAVGQGLDREILVVGSTVVGSGGVNLRRRFGRAVGSLMHAAACVAPVSL
jgi:hypothetical protein